MFSIKESLKFGWEKIDKNFWKLVGLAFITCLPSIISQMFTYKIEKADSLLLPILFFIFSIVLSIISIIIGIGFIKMLLRIYNGENPPLKEIFSAYGVFWKYIGASILYSLIIVGGLILLIVPGIIWAIKYSFTPLLVIDRKIGPIEALKESGRITNGSKWKLLGFMIVSGLVVLLGYLVFLVGALVAIPLVTLAWIWVYKKLSNSENAPVSPQIS